MKYSVIGSDGAVYGPCDRETISRWAEENRVTGGSVIILEDGSRVKAAEVFPELFAQTDSREGLNWPGLFLGPFWGISHRLWQGWAALGCWILSGYFLIAFLVKSIGSKFDLFTLSSGMLLYAAFMLAGCWLGIWMLFRGRAAARKARHFAGDKEFREVQGKWERAVAIIIVVYTALVTFNLLQAAVLMISD
ncbi:MAG: hypothetical protein IJT95_02485 [Abditibacteriota bacterium]|nr:hypothetical protein [Abditibacteriota bacterium]